jgi:endonuclease G
MKRFYLIIVTVLIFSIGFAVNLKTTAQSETYQDSESPLASPSIVISQFQTAGTNNANDEFIELHNTSSNNVDLNGLRLVYRSAAGTNDVAFVNWTSSTIIAPGGFYLIASTSYDGTTAANITYNPTACACSMSATGGGLAIRNGGLNTGIIFDSVGYGTATNVFREGTATTAPPANAGQSRLNNGCQDTDNNANDFSIVNPSAPRNTSSAVSPCGSSGSTRILAGGGANPNTVSPGETTLLTVSVLPATSPPSTGIVVIGNLSTIGGAANQQFFDNGTNGDVTANDNTFSYLASISPAASGGVRNITATASDAESRTANVSFTITVNAPVAGEDHLLMGNPSNATSDLSNENNYLMIKPQYSLSYNRSRAIPNWVSWRLDSSWIGSADRQDDFRADTSLPAGWYRVTDSSYSGSGFDRGHHTPSGDRTRSVPDNSATFLMTNMMPQSGGNNQGPWEKLETFSRSLASQGNELYIVAGSVGSGGIGSGGSVVNTIDSGRITVPAQTWKVILVLPVSDNDVARVNNNTRAIAVIMPNVESIRQDQWQKYVVSVDQVEGLTGYDFFSNVATETQAVIESRVDGQTNPNSAPTITAAFDVTRQQGNPVSNSQIATVNDADQTVNTLSLTVNGSTSATINGVTVSNIAVSASGVVTANVVAASTATAASFTLRVTDNQGSFAQATLNVTVTSGSYEADVDPRPNQAGNPFPGKSGDGIVGTGDVTQIRRFVLGFDTPETGTTNEFQKADSAPLFSFGDGIVAAGDVTQARRYALGFDALQLAAGPTVPGNSSFSGSSFVGELFNQKPVALFDNNAPLNHLRSLTPVAVTRAGSVLTVGIVLNTNFGEVLPNSLSFTLNFSNADLTNPTNIRLGSGGNSADLNFNDTQAAVGRLGILLDLPPQQTFGSASQQLVLIDFTVPIGAQTSTTLSFNDSTAPRFISDSNGNRLDDAETFASTPLSVTGTKSRKRVRFF